ncbi:MAG: HPr family phosphocarrier protein, partial [Planctomycetota bacterium]|nr:HPr family phosphocarrier protein [Planctomycetota bacterium]
MPGYGEEWQERRVSILNKDGIHMRPAAKFVEMAMSFSADVRVAKGGREFNGKSIYDMIEFAALM